MLAEVHTNVLNDDRHIYALVPSFQSSELLMMIGYKLAAMSGQNVMALFTERKVQNLSLDFNQKKQRVVPTAD